MWRNMPRTLVGAPPVTPLSTAAAAAAPFAESLAKAASPKHALDDESNFADGTFNFGAEGNPVVSEPVPIRLAKKPVEAPAPVAESGEEHISFGKRADADIKPVTIVPKSVRGYKLPPSSLLYRSEEHTVVREEALREEARV